MTKTLLILVVAALLPSPALADPIITPTIIGIGAAAEIAIAPAVAQVIGWGILTAASVGASFARRMRRP